MSNLLFWYHTLLTVIFVLAPIVFFALLFITAPYGRYAQNKKFFSVPSRAGWIIMELPAVFVILSGFLFTAPAAAYVLLLMWEFHYLQRTFVFPMQLRNPLKPMPVWIIAMGNIFNIINGFVNGVSLTVIHHYEISWLVDTRFLVGAFLFFSGFAINHHADWVLRNLRKPGESGYKIPQGKLYQWVSCPNYLGEIVQWLGWAIATWSLAGGAFFVWTAANLAPRALRHHRWYGEMFADYPKTRRALIPWVL